MPLIYGGNVDSLITQHESYLALARDSDERQMFYRDLFNVSIPEIDLHHIGASLNKNLPTGSGSFKGQIERALGRKLGSGKRGRPSQV